jgi:hypothetical protein
MQDYGELQLFQYNYQFLNCLIASRSKSLLTNSSVAFTSEAIQPKWNIINKEKALGEEVITQLKERNIELILRFSYIGLGSESPIP